MREINDLLWIFIDAWRRQENAWSCEHNKQGLERWVISRTNTFTSCHHVFRLSRFKQQILPIIDPTMMPTPFNKVIFRSNTAFFSSVSTMLKSSLWSTVLSFLQNKLLKLNK